MHGDKAPTWAEWTGNPELWDETWRKYFDVAELETKHRYTSRWALACMLHGSTVWTRQSTGAIVAVAVSSAAAAAAACNQCVTWL